MGSGSFRPSATTVFFCVSIVDDGFSFGFVSIGGDFGCSVSISGGHGFVPFRSMQRFQLLFDRRRDEYCFDDGFSSVSTGDVSGVLSIAAGFVSKRSTKKFNSVSIGDGFNSVFFRRRRQLRFYRRLSLSATVSVPFRSATLVSFRSVTGYRFGFQTIGDTFQLRFDWRRFPFRFDRRQFQFCFSRLPRRDRGRAGVSRV